MHASSTVFSDFAGQWWDEQGPFKPLHQMNPLRLEFIINHIKPLERENLEGITLLDVGCGGGLLSEPLARLGANVTGIDLSEEAIAVAQNHAKGEGLTIDYRNASLEAMKGASFDVVVASEVIEHVDDPKEFVRQMARVLKPKGCVILTTLNRTWKSYFLGICIAENILKWAPKGAHDHAMFIKPSEMNRFLEEADLRLKKLQGVIFNPLRWQWEFSDNLDVNYFAFAEKS